MPKIIPSISELAAEAGVEVYDTALPVGFLHGIIDRFGTNPSGHIVWSYGHPATLGEPVGLTETGREMVARVDAEGAAFWQSLR